MGASSVIAAPVAGQFTEEQHSGADKASTRGLSDANEFVGLQA